MYRTTKKIPYYTCLLLLLSTQCITTQILQPSSSTLSLQHFMDGSLLLVANTRHIHKHTSIQTNKLTTAHHPRKQPTKRELVLRSQDYKTPRTSLRLKRKRPWGVLYYKRKEKPTCLNYFK